VSGPARAVSVTAALGRNRHTIGTTAALTWHTPRGIVDREGGGSSPTLGWGAAVGSSGGGVAG
jgi:hypothetical protein